MNLPDRFIKSISSNKGVSLIEILITITIVTILGASTTPFLSRFILQTNKDSAVEKITSSIRKAQEYAMDGKSATTWGVCMFGTSMRLFSGSCNAPITKDDFSIPTTVTITNFTTTTFNARGEPSQALTATVTTTLETATIVLNSAGGMTLN